MFWGANPAIFAKYWRNVGRFNLAILHHEDIAPLPANAVAQSQAVPEQLTRRTTVNLYYGKIGDRLNVILGGIWGGTPKIGQTYQYVQDAAGEESFAGSGFDVLTDEIRMIDTIGGKARVAGRIGKVQGFIQGAYKGLVADGGWENWRPGTRLGESGRGNQMSAWGGAEVNLGNLMIATSGIAQRPLVGPNPNIAPSIDEETFVFFRGVGARNFIADPFAVLENREMLAGELILKWDPTPISYFYQWDNEFREDAGFAGDIAFVYKHMPTIRDSNFGFLADGTLFSFDGSPPAADVWEVSTRIVTNLGDAQLHWSAYAGTAQARGTDDRLIFRKGGGIKAFYRSLVVDSWVKFDDWGPYDFHRDFNLTFPVQTYLDISGGLSRPPLGQMATRFGAFAKYRFLDEFSPVPQSIGGTASADGQLSAGDPWNNEFAIGTYVRLSL